jgi:hypothetical protein
MEGEMSRNPFESDKDIAVVCPTPANREQEILKLLALKFGRPLPRGYADGTRFLYGQRSHGSSNHHDHDADAKARAEGVKLFIPEWITNLSYEFGGYYMDEVDAAYKRGKAHGKHLLSRLATGDMTVLDFEDHRS